jgi:glucose/arabinose dehydrogenase
LNLLRFKTFKLFLWFIFFSGSFLAEKNFYELEIIADDLDHPWSAVELPSGEILFTEMPGNIKLISSDGSKITNIENAPMVLFAGQGGLSDITLHPDFSANGWIYFSYSSFSGTVKNFSNDYISSSARKKPNTLYVDRAKIINNRLVERENIFKAKADRRAPVHFGAKLLFLNDKSLLITSGDGFDFREEAQQLDNHFGKIIRILDDGGIPEDNPFVNRPNALHDIWAYGVRNPQGIFLDKNGLVFENEHGPRGGDELNIIKPGNNYGWPAITYGIDYVGSLISPFKKKEGMQQPVYYWTPSIAPSGMTIYEKDLFPQWKNKILISSLVFNNVRAISIDSDNRFVKEDILFGEIDQRIRNILTLSSGELLIITDKENGQIIKVKKNK